MALTLERLNGVEEVDTAAGHAYGNLPAHRFRSCRKPHAHGFLFALDWGARGSAVVGGGLSTNAGGNRVILVRHGP